MNVEKSHERIFQILEMEIDLYERFLSLSKKERGFILSNDTGGILSICLQKERQISKVKKLDASLKLLWRSGIGSKGRDMDKITKLVERLGLIMEEIRSLHHESKKLLEKEINEVLSKLRGLKKTEEFFRVCGSLVKDPACFISLNE